MRVFRCIAAALVVTGIAAADVRAQSLAGGEVSGARAGFGLSLALGENELFIGEPNNSTRPGQVYVYRRGPAGWEESARLSASDAEPSDGFGQKVVVEGNTLFVGVPASEENRGTVYVFERSSAGWAQTGQLTGDDLEGTNRFGSAIAATSDYAFISAPAQEQGTGAVYVFRRSASGWVQTAKLFADSVAPRSTFGSAVTVQGGHLFVSAPGINQNRGVVSIYSHDTQTGAWNSAGTLPTPELGANSRFGWAITSADGSVIVSAPGANSVTGTAYTFRQAADGTWSQQAQLSPDDAAPNTIFGIQVAADGNQLLAGAPGADTARGAVFHFMRDADGTWSAPHRIAPARPLQRGGQFGGALAVRGDVAAATIAGADYGLGAVLVFEHRNGAWAQSALLTGPVETLASVTGGEVRCSDDGTAADFDCRDVEMLSFLSIPDLGGSRGVRLNDIWGWTDPETGREYALVGRMDGMSAVDVSDPTNPVFVADLPLTKGATPSTWRDIKVYRNHAYVVADGSGAHGVQVLDLTKLRAFDGTPLDLEADTTYHNVNSVHNIVINEESGFAYVVGASQGGETCGGGLHMIDIREPKNPTFAGCFSDPQTGRASTGYSHDAQCVMYNGPDTRYRGREICFGSNETALSIADVTDKQSPVALSRASYPSVAYSHQGWLDDGHRYFYMNDELDEMQGFTAKTRTLVWDLADLEDPQLVREHMGVEPAIDHNLYIRGDLMYQSNYRSGLRILDISDRENPREVAFFKTYPGDDADPQFDGSWSNYPYFDSGIIIVSSIGEGLFVLKKRDTTTVF
ncbi:MAG: choice-of-anchor B family protein [Gemmatimonadetes bacterium]|nr:choice-of-anchor B family protein [Gemmatimonadota bacterium]